MQYNPSRFLAFLPLLALLAGAAGCTPLSETEKEYMEKRKTEKDLQENFSRRLENSEQYNGIIQKVRQYPVEGATPSENWVKLRLNQVTDQIIFQKWTASQKSTDRYEVRFLYTLLTKNYEARKHGFLWTVDNTLDRITGPIELSPEELEPAYKKRGRSQAEIKRQQNRWSLE